MAVEKIKDPWLYVSTAREQRLAIWYCLNPVAWTDSSRNAQNAADQTGQTQHITVDGIKVTHLVTPDERRYTALHATHEVISHG